MNDPDEFDDEFEDEPDEEDDSSRYDALPASSVIRTLRPAMAAAAQRIYDAWVQDEHDDLNGGGICHLIADEVATIMGNSGIPVSTQTANDVQHVYCVGQFSDGVFEVDIPYRLYERGGGFTWTKIPDVHFTQDDILTYQLDGDPSQMYMYVEEWQEE